ncbi:MAG TPA: VWA domain-containing protein [Candidatus Sulfotelmatobacter sp.]|nr:VWA domain-containing protein [Candidatus Sulfotelmatobacter sp.]
MQFLGRALRVFGFVACAFWMAGGPSGAQIPVSPNTNPTFHTATHLVVVNVVATDRDGKPISGLKKQDFKLSEDGKVQSIQVFESHMPSRQSSVVPDMGPDQHTHFPNFAADGAINAILFDLLNTLAEDQSYAKQQLIEFLGTLPHGQRVALFTLNGDLRMVGDFTTPTQELIAAVNILHPSISSLLPDRNREGWRANNIYSAAYSWPSNSNTPEPAMPIVGNETAWWWADMRFQQTFEAMGKIANALSGYAGRKNLLWLSGGFPGAVSLNRKEPRFESSDYLAIFQKYSGKLESSQISLYPIDLQGLNNTGRPGIPESSENVSTAIDSRQAMDEIAAQTGGCAFYNMSDLRLAMQRSIEHGATYYTLAYSPRNQKWNGAFRRITVKVNLPGVKLDYREGYYATKDRLP